MLGIPKPVPGGEEEPGHELAMNLRAAYMALHRETDAALARHGITADQFVVLCALAGGGVQAQRELVARTASDPSTLRAMLVLLESRGLVERPPHPTDGRARSVRLTAPGRRALARTWKATKGVRQRLATALIPRETGRLGRSLERVATVMNRPSTAAKAGVPRGAGGRRRP
jgi:DNA-binding MarR family transcriptional regulator